MANRATRAGTLEPTYEGLKPGRLRLLAPDLRTALEPTYEGLKHLPCLWENMCVLCILWSLPMRD